MKEEYKDYRTKKSFEKAFIKAVPNFDETKIHFIHPSSMHDQSKVCFVVDGKLKKFPMYKSSYYVEMWKNHFIEFLNTGKFDMNFYVSIHNGKRSMDGKIHKFPFVTFYGNEFYDHSDASFALLDHIRKTKGDCGMKTVAKPLDEMLPANQEPKIIKGFVTGSFRPFHKGHMALIEFAKQNCDKLTILVTTLPDEIISYKHRLSWVLSTYLNDPQVDIINAIIDEPTDLTYDKLSAWWGNFVKNTYGHFDKVFTSEDYGKVFAKTMGAENCVFDIARGITPISATAIREKPFANWDYINNFAKDYFTKKIAIVGTESTGKTVLSAQLAKHFNTAWCPELGRDIVQNSEKTTMEDIKLIGIEHAKHILKYTRQSNKILIVDTDLSITKSYSKFLFGEVPEFDDWVEKANEFDLYIYLDSNAPYVDDGTRFNKEKRNELEQSHLEMFKNEGVELHRFDFDTAISKAEAYEKRFTWIVECIESFMKKY
jgi:HTH-type transcriptional repressor of NAD biosynthesis genes